jgi:ABC-2 type transport system permease protein
MNLGRLLALMRKELVQTLRDRTTLFVVLSIPIIELFLFAYAVDLTVDHIPTAVVDLSLDGQSMALTSALETSGFFDTVVYLSDEQAVIEAIDQGQVKAGIVIPPGLAANMERGTAQILILLDGSDSFTVQSGYSAALAITHDQAVEFLVWKVDRLGGHLETSPIRSSINVLYNPTLDDMIFIVPAMAGILMQLMSVNLAAVSVVKERELGTIEQLLATPIRPIELMLAKTVPNMAVCAVAMVIVVALGISWFGVPFRGDPILFVLLSLLFLLSGIGLGLVISTIAETQRQAQQFTTLLMLLSLLLTGFIYPRAPMPAGVRAVSNLIPLTYFVRIIRAIFTKGVGIAFLKGDVVALSIYTAILILTAAATFRKRLD